MPINPAVLGTKIGPFTKTYDWKDVVLYALGVGAGFDEIQYCFEYNLKAIPSFAIGANFDLMALTALNAEANLAGVLHGEQDIVFHRPIPIEGTLTTAGAIKALYDLGEKRGALVVAEADTVHSNGEKLFTNTVTLFCRRDGGFGGKLPPAEMVDFPPRDPDRREPACPAKDQPLLYRLSGDIFALHASPEFAQALGFERPIMHGLCTHGFACRALVKHLFPREPERIRRLRARFTKPLYPGVPIETQIWKMDRGRAYFRTLNTQTAEVVIDRGIVEWEEP